MNLLQYSAFSPYCTMFKQPSIPRLNILLSPPLMVSATPFPPDPVTVMTVIEIFCEVISTWALSFF